MSYSICESVAISNNMTYKTEQRNLLLSFLMENPDTMFSAKQIEAALANKNISRSAVYRNLAELENENKIRRCSVNGSREVLYQFFDIQSCRNHIHLSCKKCGKIFHMENQVADSFINEISESQGFNISKAETTLYGLCAQCK